MQPSHNSATHYKAFFWRYHSGAPTPAPPRHPPYWALTVREVSLAAVALAARRARRQSPVLQLAGVKKISPHENPRTSS